jgi:hypothetical protein
MSSAVTAARSRGIFIAQSASTMKAVRRVWSTTTEVSAMDGDLL